jgi:type II secretory ATPase GspE/PulE/Tfp pilus assembly ATPase PilB-like protein
MDIIGQNPLFVSAIRLIMAQRLVRRLDDKTKEAYTPDAKTLENLQHIVDSLPPGVHKPDLTNIQLYKPGKSPENPYGYSGQIALREQFMMTGEIRQLLENGGQPTAQEIEEAAVRSGMLTMLQDGVLRAIVGDTSLEEVLRVVG